MSVLRFAVKYFEEIVAGVFMVLMSVTTFANVLARYFFNSPIQWAEELARYSFIWVVFAGAVVCTKRKRHITIDMLEQALPGHLHMVDVGQQADGHDLAGHQVDQVSGITGDVERYC